MSSVFSDRGCLGLCVAAAVRSQPGSGPLSASPKPVETRGLEAFPWVYGRARPGAPEASRPLVLHSVNLHRVCCRSSLIPGHGPVASASTPNAPPGYLRPKRPTQRFRARPLACSCVALEGVLASLGPAQEVRSAASLWSRAVCRLGERGRQQSRGAACTGSQVIPAEMKEAACLGAGVRGWAAQGRGRTAGGAQATWGGQEERPFPEGQAQRRMLAVSPPPAYKPSCLSECGGEGNSLSCGPRQPGPSAKWGEVACSTWISELRAPRAAFM